MMHLEAIKERNRKPAPQPREDEKHWAYDDRVRKDITGERVTPMASIDAAPVPEYMQRAELERRGFIVGARDKRLNRKYSGRYMVVAAHDESELPTNDGANGPWCIVGNDLNALITQAYELAPWE